MPFSSLRTYAPPEERVIEKPAWVWEAHGHRLRRLLEGGSWTVHDIINRAEVRSAIREQFRLALRMEQDREMASYLAFLERVS